jgi:hypothetical protein
VISISRILAPAPCRWAITCYDFVTARENFVEKGFSNSRRAACYHPSELWHSRFEAAGVQEWGSSTNFSRVEILGEKTSRLGAFDSERFLEA